MSVGVSLANDTPTGQVADVEIDAAYDDLDAITAFVRKVDVVTFEFENVPAETADLADHFVPVRPGGRVLHITQHRVREKTFLRAAGFPTAPFAVARSLPDLHQALATVGGPAVLKTSGWGYDGKGQALVQGPHEAEAAWQLLKTDEVVLEGFVDFECELSVIVARGTDGLMVTYGPFENKHRNHILDISCAPARVPERICVEALDMSQQLAVELEFVGVLCVEMFLTRDARTILAAPDRHPHSSARVTSSKRVEKPDTTEAP